MASAREYRPGKWAARFRGFLKAGRGATAQVTIPGERLRAGHQAEDAQAFAEECDRACRLLEVNRSVANIQRARALGAIDDTQADALLARQPAAASSGAGALAPLTIIDAARSHPSSHRESMNDIGAAVRHERELGAFMEWGQVRLVSDITLDLVMRYVDHLTKRGLSWDGRRHALLWIRRATFMASHRGLPDVLAKLKLDSRPVGLRSIALSWWTLPELARAALRADDMRLRVTVALGGFIGLRPSEICAVEIPHLSSDDLLDTGNKNEQSVRRLPLPAYIAGWMRELAGRRQSGRLVAPHPDWSKGRGAFNEHSFYRWFVPAMEAASGKKLGPKFLRKSFSTWGFRTPEMPSQHVEGYMGHKTALVSLVRGRHYLPELIARELLPTREVIARVTTAALDQARAELDAEGTPGRNTTQAAS